MGEAKRKRLASRVQKPLRFVECFLAQSTVSDAHAVYLGIGRGLEITIHRLQSFTSIVDAWKFLRRATKVLLKFNYFDNQDCNEIASNFISILDHKYGHLFNDDPKCMLENTDIAIKGIAQGRMPNVNELPPGVNRDFFHPPVQKKYKVLYWLRTDPIKSLCGNPQDTCWFSVGESHDNPLLVDKGNPLICSSYVTAAYIADYVNTHNQEGISEQEFAQLTHEANNLQGKVTSKIEKIGIIEF